METPTRPRILVSDAGPDAFEPMARVLLGKLGYLILVPGELEALDDAAVEPEFRIVEAEQLGRVGEDASSTRYLVVGGGPEATRDADDPRVVGHLARPTGVEELYRTIQELTEATPRSVPRVRTRLEARCQSGEQGWEAVIDSLSEGGCLVRGERALEVGSRVFLDFVLPEQGRVEVEGVVGYASAERAGVVFRDLPADASARIGSFVADQLLG